MPTSDPVMPELRRIVCCTPFDLAAGETAVVLRHVAYYDFVLTDPVLPRLANRSSLSPARLRRVRSRP